MSFASASVSAGVKPSVLPTSLMAARDFIVPNVTIWQTDSFPYFCRTYSITSPRRSKQKSTSTSGIDTRSGFRKRSNRRSRSEERREGKSVDLGGRSEIKKKGRQRDACHC